MKFTDKQMKEAYEMCKIATRFETITDDQLKAAEEWADELRFYADMSDDYSVTRRERHEINKVMSKVYKEMDYRGI